MDGGLFIIDAALGNEERRSRAHASHTITTLPTPVPTALTPTSTMSTTATTTTANETTTSTATPSSTALHGPIKIVFLSIFGFVAIILIIILFSGFITSLKKIYNSSSTTTKDPRSSRRTRNPRRSNHVRGSTQARQSNESDGTFGIEMSRIIHPNHHIDYFFNPTSSPINRPQPTVNHRSSTLEFDLEAALGAEIEERRERSRGARWRRRQAMLESREAQRGWEDENGEPLPVYEEVEMLPEYEEVDVANEWPLVPPPVYRAEI